MSIFRFAAGFRSAAGRCGLKASGNPDLSLLVADSVCIGAGVFTTSLVKAAPVLYDQAVLAEHASEIRAIIANAGCANACTGAQGDAAAREMARLAAEAVGCEPYQVLVLSTGVIGHQLNVEKVAKGVAAIAPELGVEHAPALAEAIMTTDTRPKTSSATAVIDGVEVTVAGVAKGAGMIHPMMATMLSIVTTDAAIDADLAQSLLREVTDASFNCVTVDGDPSTNDTLLLLASGVSGVTINANNIAAFRQALEIVCIDLAKQIAADGEGATKLITITVDHAPSVAAARTIARKIACSPLVKTAIHGGDPNWGRILAAAGVAGVPFDPSQVELWLGEVQLVAGGTPTNYNEREAASQISGQQVAIRLNLGAGAATGYAWTCDFSAEYVRINADYRT